MSVNGVTGNYSSYSSVSSTVSSKTDAAKTTETTGAATSSSGISEEAAVYESSGAAEKSATYKPNTEMINKLKADAEAHTQQLQDIVNKLLLKQGTTFDIANGNNLKSMYESLEVDEETRAQAKKDIADDGYWGVEQTSSRIFDFAMALSGGDPDKMDKMKDAFLKGFEKAEKAWGDELPEISQKTYGAVLKKFEDYKSQMSQSEE